MNKDYERGFLKGQISTRIQEVHNSEGKDLRSVNRLIELESRLKELDAEK